MNSDEDDDSCIRRRGAAPSPRSVPVEPISQTKQQPHPQPKPYTYGYGVKRCSARSVTVGLRLRKLAFSVHYFGLHVCVGGRGRDV